MPHNENLPPGQALSWGAAPPPRRGPRPAHTVAQIVEAAVRLADNEGISGASLPNIAHELGLTTNALYRYVSSKDELIVLLADAGWETPIGLAPTDDWRADVRAWVYAVLDRITTRTWLLEVDGLGDPLTPNRLVWTEILMDALVRAGVGQRHLLGCATLVHGFAQAAAVRLSAKDAWPAPVNELAHIRGHLQPRLRERGLPHLADLVAAGGYPSGMAEDLIDPGLDYLLAGIAGFTG